LWAASIHANGYGQLRRNGIQGLAHRVVYELLVGPITEATLDHLCRVRSCVNPDHLEPASMRENLMRGDTIPAHNAVKTHCRWGHPFDDENTYIWRTERRCRACGLVASRRYRQRSMLTGH